MMTKVWRSTCFAIGGLLLASTPALAKDLCFYSGSATSPFLVARPWKLPPRGKCKPFTGTGGTAGMAHGTVCRNTDGDVLRFGITLNRQGAIFTSPFTQQISIGMSYPAMTSPGAEAIVVTFGESNVTSTSIGNIHAAACTKSPIN